MNNVTDTTPRNYDGSGSPAPGMQGVNINGASGPTVYVVTQSQKPVENALPRKAIIIMASLQIVAAFIAFVAQIVLIFADNYYYGVGFIGTGIWCGVFFAISGSLGILAAVSPSKCRTVAFLVMSILTACLCVPMITISGFGVGESDREYYCGSGAYGSKYCKNPDEEVQKALNSVQILIALTVAVLAITMSACSCRVLCCQQTNQVNRTNQTGMVTLAPSVGMPMQYVHQMTMPTHAQPVIQYNGMVANTPGTTYYTVPLQTVQGGSTQPSGY